MHGFACISEQHDDSLFVHGSGSFGLPGRDDTSFRDRKVSSLRRVFGKVLRLEVPSLRQ